MRSLKICNVTHILLLILGIAFSAAGAENAVSEGVTKTPYTGWNESLLIAIPDSHASLVVAPEVGGRILNYSLDSDSILYDVAGSEGKTLGAFKNFWVGGYQCDVGPELRVIPDHLPLWQGPYKWESGAPYTVHVVSEDYAPIGIRMEKVISADPHSKSATIKVIQKIKNVSGNEIAYCLWDRTLCKGGGYVIFPVNKNSKFPAQWSLRETKDGKYVFNGAPALPNVKLLDGILVAQAGGTPTGKLGADSDAGWIAYAREKMLYIKTFPYFKEGYYSDGGNSVEFYWSDKVGEVEPLSPEVKLAPGQEYEFTEHWMLAKIDNPVDSFEKARALTDQINALVQNSAK